VQNEYFTGISRLVTVKTRFIRTIICSLNCNRLRKSSFLAGRFLELLKKGGGNFQTCLMQIEVIDQFQAKTCSNYLTPIIITNLTGNQTRQGKINYP
jgi:hypothetical protein